MKLFLATIGPDLLGIFILLITGYLIWADRLLEEWRRSALKKLIILIVIIMVLEILSIFFQQEAYANHLLLNKLVNLIGFSAAPFVVLWIVFLCGDKKIEKKWKYLVPLWVWFLLCIGSMWNGWIFKVTYNNPYQRGVLFFLSPIFLLYGGFVFIYFIKKKIVEHTHIDKKFIYLMATIIIVGGLIQTKFQNILFIWPSFSVVMLIYYFFLRQRNLQFDQLTNVRDRKSFMEQMQFYNAQSTMIIFMFDINQLKQINDNYGHSEGDLYILEAVGIIKICLEKSGTIYRIGGDEFVVLCPEMTAPKLKMILHHLKAENQRSFRLEKAQYPKTMLAYGYSQFMGEESDSLDECVKRADQAMYRMKAKIPKTINT